MLALALSSTPVSAPQAPPDTQERPLFEQSYSLLDAYTGSQTIADELLPYLNNQLTQLYATIPRITQPIVETAKIFKPRKPLFGIATGRYDKVIEEASARAGIDKYVAIAMFLQESDGQHFDEKGKVKRSPRDAVGIGQMKRIAYDHLREKSAQDSKIREWLQDLELNKDPQKGWERVESDPYTNAEAAVIYLGHLTKKHGVRGGLARYNGGNHPPVSSYQYADDVLHLADKLRQRDQRDIAKLKQYQFQLLLVSLSIGLLLKGGAALPILQEMTANPVIKKALLLKFSS